MAVDTNTMKIVVDDGYRLVPIENKYGEKVGEFRFRPTDIGIIERYNRLADSFDKITEPLENVDISPEGTAEDEMNPEEAAALKEAEKRLFEAVDDLFGGNMAEAFFGKMHPFSPVNGVFYCETAIEAVGNYISAQFDSETKKITKRVNRYVKGYKPKTGGRK